MAREAALFLYVHPPTSSSAASSKFSFSHLRQHLRPSFPSLYPQHRLRPYLIKPHPQHHRNPHLLTQPVLPAYHSSAIGHRLHLLDQVAGETTGFHVPVGSYDSGLSSSVDWSELEHDQEAIQSLSENTAVDATPAPSYLPSWLPLPDPRTDSMMSIMRDTYLTD